MYIQNDKKERVTGLAAWQVGGGGSTAATKER